MPALIELNLEVFYFTFSLKSRVDEFFMPNTLGVVKVCIWKDRANCTYTCILVVNLYGISMVHLFVQGNMLSSINAQIVYSCMKICGDAHVPFHTDIVCSRSS